MRACLAAHRRAGHSRRVAPGRPLVTHKRTDLDQRAYELRQQGLTYRAIAKWLGVTLAITWRRVLRHERMLREAHGSDEKSRSEERL